jgi:hypothetical protein
MRLRLKKLLPVIITITFLFNLNSVPANALENGRYDCHTGEFGIHPSNYLVVNSNVVVDGSKCYGDVIIPNGVISIDFQAFYNNPDITSVTIPDSVTTIGARAFENNSILAIVRLGNSVSTISEYAFGNNDSLTSVTFFGNEPATVSNDAFYRFRTPRPRANVLYNATGFGANGSTWKYLTVKRGIVNCSTSGYFTIDNDEVKGHSSCVGSVNIPSGVTSIGENAFLETTSITSVTIPNTVTSIGINAFRNATSLTDVTIPDSVITISNGAFRDTRFSSITLGNSVTTIGVRAFGDSRLTSVTIPNSVSTINGFAFQSITTLASVTFLGNAPATVQADAFDGVPTGTPANVAYNATGFPTNGSTWNGLIVSYGSAPAGDSNSTTATVITPKVAKNADVVFNLKNKKYLSKNAMKTKLSKNKSFKRNPKDLYKYSIFGTSKKTCAIQGNYVTSLKKTGTCDLYATRTTTKGVKYKYWVQINYTK